MVAIRPWEIIAYFRRAERIIQSMAKQNTLLIINPVAGRRKANRLLDKIVDSLSQNAYEAAVFTTTRKGEAIDIVKEHAAKSQRIICCGGDGTLNEVFTGLAMADLQIPVGYIPTGTTNDFARSLKLPKNSSKVIDAAVNGPIRQHDIGAFNQNQYFSYVASFGAFTKASYSTPQWLKNMMGHAAYVFSGILSAADIHSHTLKVIADGQEIAGDFIFGSVSNSTVIAGLVKLPEADISLNDGEFEVMLIRAPKNAKELQAVVGGILRQRYDERHVHFFKASELSFSFAESTAWTIDGEYAGTLETVGIKNLHSMAQVAVSSGIA